MSTYKCILTGFQQLDDRVFHVAWVWRIVGQDFPFNFPGMLYNFWKVAGASVGTPSHWNNLSCVVALKYYDRIRPLAARNVYC